MPERYGGLIREGYEAWNTGDRSWVLEHLSPEVEWVTPPNDPDQGVYRGHEAVIWFWDQWRSAVGQLSFEIVDIVEAGDRALVQAKRSGVGHHSGLRVSDEVCQVFFFSGDTCTAVHEFYDRAAAEAAAGITRKAESEQRA